MRSPTYAAAHAHHRPVLISCPASGSWHRFGTALRLHVTCSRQASLFMLLRPGSVLLLQPSHDWQAGVFFERFESASPSGVQDQGLISPRSNRRRSLGTTSRARRQLGSDFGQAGKVW